MLLLGEFGNRHENLAHTLEPDPASHVCVQTGQKSLCPSTACGVGGLERVVVFVIVFPVI